MKRRKYLMDLNRRNSLIALISGFFIMCATLYALAIDDNWIRTIANRRQLEYFTVLSNLMNLVGASFTIPFAVQGCFRKRFSVPRWLSLIQFSCSLNMLLVLVIVLIATLITGDWYANYGDNDIYLHLICPLCTLLFFQFIESGDIISQKQLLLCELPYILYLLAYWLNVFLLHIWRDVYGIRPLFAEHFPHFILILPMILSGYLLGLILAQIQKRRILRQQRRFLAAWGDSVTALEAKIEAFGLGRYHGRLYREPTVPIPMDLFELLEDAYSIPARELVSAYARGLTDARSEQRKAAAERRPHPLLNLIGKVHPPQKDRTVHK